LRPVGVAEPYPSKPSVLQKKNKDPRKGNKVASEDTGEKRTEIKRLKLGNNLAPKVLGKYKLLNA